MSIMAWIFLAVIVLAVGWALFLMVSGIRDLWWIWRARRLVKAHERVSRELDALRRDKGM